MDRPDSNSTYLRSIGLLETQARVRQLEWKARTLDATPARRPKRDTSPPPAPPETKEPAVLENGSKWYGSFVPSTPRVRPPKEEVRKAAKKWSNRKDLPPTRQLVQTLPPRDAQYKEAVQAKLREKIDNMHEEVKERRRELHQDVDAINKLPEEVASRTVKKWMIKARKNLLMRRNQLDVDTKMCNEWAVSTLLAEVKRDKVTKEEDTDRRDGQRLSFAHRPA